MKKIVVLSVIAAASLGLAACNKSEPAATNEVVAENATENAAVADINAAVDNVAEASNAAVDNAAEAPADNAANAM